MNPYQAPPVFPHSVDALEVSTGEDNYSESETPAEAAALGAALGAVAGWAVLSFFDLGALLFHRGAIAAGIAVAMAVFFIHRRQRSRRNA